MASMSHAFKNNPFINRAKHSPIVLDSFWALLGNIFGKGFSLLLGIALANILGSYDYGQYGMIRSTLIYLSIFSTFGLGVTGTKFVSQFVQEKPSDVLAICKTIMRITLCTSVSIAVLLLVFARPIAVFMEAPNLSSVLRLSTLAIIFNSINSSQVGILAGFKAFKTISRNSIYAGLFNCTISFLFTVLWGLRGAIWAISLAYLFNCVINRLSLNSIVYSSAAILNRSGSMAKEMLSFSLPIALQEGLQALSQWLTIAVLVKLSSYSELGLYSATSQWTAIVIFIPSVLKNVTLSYLSGDQSGHNKTVKRMLMINALAAGLIVFVIVCFSKIICDWYGSSFIGLRPVLIIMVFSSVFGAVGSVYIQELISNSKNWTAFVISFVKSCLIIIIGYCLIEFIGCRAALSFAIASVLANILFIISLSVQYNKTYSIK
jgi:O-antigen/teichoic acid export membrane protein